MTVLLVGELSLRGVLEGVGAEEAGEEVVGEDRVAMRHPRGVRRKAGR